VLIGEETAAPAGAAPAGCRVGRWAIAERGDQAKIDASAMKSPARIDFLVANGLSIGAYGMSFLDINQARHNESGLLDRTEGLNSPQVGREHACPAERAGQKRNESDRLPGFVELTRLQETIHGNQSYA